MRWRLLRSSAASQDYLIDARKRSGLVKLDIPLIRPEELLSGYRARLRLLNELADGGAVTAAMNADGATRSRATLRIKSFAELTAEANDIDVCTVAAHHSMWPLLYALNRPSSNEEVRAFASSRAGRTALMECPLSRSRFCPRCVEEDLSFWHFSYWRRSHQMPGTFRCEKHGCLLRSGGVSIDTGLPHHALADDSFEVSAADEGWATNETIGLFVELTLAVLENGPALNRGHTARALGQAFSTKYKTSPTANAMGKRSLELIRERVPPLWLRYAFPSLSWNTASVVTTISCAFKDTTVPTSVFTVCLIASLCHDNVDDALGNLCSPNPHRLKSEASI